MWVVYLIMFLITAAISWLWANGIEKQRQFKKDNPDHDEKKGWLDWDCNNSHTESDF